MIGRILYITDEIGQQYADEVRSVWHKHGFELSVVTIEAAITDKQLEKYILVANAVRINSGDDFLSYLRILREMTNSPIVFMPFGDLTQEQEINAYYFGADQIINLPTDITRAVAISLAQIRRYTELNNREFTPTTTYIGYKMFLDINRYSVCVNGIEIELYKKEFDILKYLMEHAGRIMTYEQIISEVWGEEYIGDPKDILWQQIHSLREKIQIDPSLPQYIKTKHGVGYSFDSRLI